jgi:hypothetical protein
VWVMIVWVMWLCELCDCVCYVIVWVMWLCGLCDFRTERKKDIEMMNGPAFCKLHVFAQMWESVRYGRNDCRLTVLKRIAEMNTGARTMRLIFTSARFG